MLRFSDSKTMAKVLRKTLAERRIDITHSDSLEVVARQFGFANWNMLSARIEGDEKAPSLPHGWFVTSQGRPDLYRIGVDPGVPGSVKIETLDRTDTVTTDAMGSLMQSIVADEFRGKLVRIGAELRSRAAERGVLWSALIPTAVSYTHLTLPTICSV